MSSRRRRYRARPKPELKKPPANAAITASEVRLIGVEGEQLGVVTLEKAKELAEAVDSDLVAVAQKADPPVVRIMDLGKHMYEQRKKHAKQKSMSKGGEVKGVRISFKIGAHDLQLRRERAIRFLDEGHKVKLEMRLRGREKGRADMARDKILEFIKEIPGAALEGNMSRAPNNISAVIARSKAAAPPKEDS
ncbi:translation initiation factor IF-3 [bacterium]|nr:translation initiation factor IF-3 [bacterium]